MQNIGASTLDCKVWRSRALRLPNKSPPKASPTRVLSSKTGSNCALDTEPLQGVASWFASPIAVQRPGRRSLQVAANAFEGCQALSIPGGICYLFPRVRTPCGRSAQVIIEGKETQHDEGEKNTSNPKTKQQTPNKNQTKPKHHQGPEAGSPSSERVSSVRG